MDVFGALGKAEKTSPNIGIPDILTRTGASALPGGCGGVNSLFFRLLVDPFHPFPMEGLESGAGRVGWPTGGRGIGTWEVWEMLCSSIG